MDAELHNGIGHHGAHYEASADAVVLYETKGAPETARTLRYTDFADRVLKLFAAAELAAIYHHYLHIVADGRLS